MEHVIFLDKCAVAPGITLPPIQTDHEWSEYEYTEPHELVSRAEEATIAITCGAPLKKAELEQLPNLKMISVAMTGSDHVDLEYCRERGIVVSNVPAYSPATVAEHALGLLLALRRKILAYHQLLDSDHWYSDEGQTSVFLDHDIYDIHQSRIGIVGTGMIGQAMGKLTQGLGMDVVYYNPTETNMTLNMVSFEELLSTCDAISIHCPLTDSTRDMFTRESFRSMKKNAVLINAARGGIINEDDLIEAIKTGELAGVALDSIVHEPISPSEPLLSLMKHPNFIMTPHVAWSSRQSMQGLMDRAIANINHFLSGNPINQI
jgi:glycerate dehydrogenase